MIPTDPLSGRWIRFWAWPFGMHGKVPLAEAAAASREGAAVALREERERVRLLYVGFTRARDHLVLVARYNAKRGAHATAWLDDLADEGGKALVRLPTPSEAKSALELRGRKDKILRADARHWLLDGTAEPTAVVARDEHLVFERPEAPRTERASYWIAPSRAAEEWPEVASVAHTAGGAEPMARRFPSARAGASNGTSSAARSTGFSLRIFPACPHATARSGRASPRGGGPTPVPRARVAPSGWRSASQLGGVAVVEGNLAARGGRHGVVTTAEGAKRVSGTIDLLLETPHGVVLVDHKSYPGGPGSLGAKALGFAPQLGAYARVLEMAGRHVLSQWVHFPLGAHVVLVRASA